MAPASAPGVAASDRRTAAESPRFSWIVDAGFAALLVVSTLRYFTVHPFDARGALALAFALATGAAYAIAVLGAATGRRSRIGMLAAILLWIPLVLLAPTFSWASFALFFAVHRVFSRTQAQWISAVIVLVVCAGMFVLSGGSDPGLVMGPLLGGFVLSFVYFQLDRALDERNRVIDELISARAQLAQAERAAGALSERARVASELHDTVVQQTASALLLLESSDDETGTSGVGEARSVLRESLRETRQLLHGLSAPRATGDPLAEALSALVATQGAEYVVVGEPRDVNEQVAHTVLRVAQEALTNVDKHAGATETQVTLTFFDDAIAIDVADNGVGFDTDPEVVDSAQGAGLGGADLTGGYGLRAMAWRIENLGGKFDVESARGQGTVIAGYIPDPSKEHA